jgi:hypothetical protein
MFVLATNYIGPDFHHGLQAISLAAKKPLAGREDQGKLAHGF